MVQMKDKYKMHLIENAFLRFHLCKYQGPYAEPCSLACKQLILQWPRGSYSGLRDYLKLFQSTNSIQSMNQVKKKNLSQIGIDQLIIKTKILWVFILLIFFRANYVCMYLFTSRNLYWPGAEIFLLGSIWPFAILLIGKFPKKIQHPPKQILPFIQDCM